jgi:alkylated DNA nucleotide flippase Atl1
MPKTPSLAFARIRAEVIAATCAVPRGRVTTYSAIAKHLEVTPRYVAFVLAALKGAEVDTIPWYRVVAAGGELRSGSEAGLKLQRRRLAAEGIRVVRGKVPDFDERAFRWPERPDRPGMPVRRRYADLATRPLFPGSVKFGYPER